MKISSKFKINSIKKILNKINLYKMKVSKLSDEELKCKTNAFKTELKNGKTLDELLPEAFAVVFEVCKRVLKLETYDVQILGAILLHQGYIAEMKTGEGKTLSAVFPAYLNALTGKGVHIVTTNDYLAKRDKEQMGKVFEFLGITVGVILTGMSTEERQAAYNSDITYGSNKEFGFDYLRDNLATDYKNIVQRKLNYAIIDEADSVLIDDAQLPLIVSNTKTKINPYHYAKANQFVRRLHGVTVEKIKNKRHSKKLEKYDYVFDLHTYSVYLTEKGVRKAEEDYVLKNFYDIKNFKTIHYVHKALIAHTLMKKDIDYIVDDGKVFVVDQNIGRVSKGKQFNDGLQQAIEAKEYLENTNEGEILASITFQNYFKMYDKISGMTGTIMSSRKEIEEIYHLDCFEVPTNRNIKRKDRKTKVYLNNIDRNNAILQEVKETYKKGQPVLIGTSSIQTSEILSEMLEQADIPHEVLNAKNPEREADIISKAGGLKRVTISTNMAGRGTDIKLQNEEVKALGGLKIIGAELNNSIRVDEQLKGRSGRQGDIGESIFFVSVEQENLKPFVRTTIFDNSNSLEKKCKLAQKEIEGKNIAARKAELRYDDIINLHRNIIYDERRTILENNEKLEEFIKNLISKMLDIYTTRENRVINKIETELGTEEPLENALKKYEDNKKEFGEDFDSIRKEIMLKAVDSNWKEHLNIMEELKYGMPLRYHRKKDPYFEFVIESYKLFEELENTIVEDIVMNLLFMTKINKETEK